MSVTLPASFRRSRQTIHTAHMAARLEVDETVRPVNAEGIASVVAVRVAENTVSHGVKGRISPWGNTQSAASRPSPRPKASRCRGDPKGLDACPRDQTPISDP